MTEFHWIDEHQKAFDLLKAHMTSMPILGFLDFSHPLELGTDASLQGLEAVLSQRDEHSRSRVVAFASCCLHPNKRKMVNYSLTKLKLLTLKWAVMEKFWDYILGPNLLCK